MQEAFPLISLVLLGLLLYFYSIRPQQQRAREQEALLSSLTEGDEVITASGIYGFIAAMDGDVVWLEAANGVELKISKSSVAAKVAIDADED